MLTFISKASYLILWVQQSWSLKVEVYHVMLEEKLYHLSEELSVKPFVI